MAKKDKAKNEKEMEQDRKNQEASAESAEQQAKNDGPDEAKDSGAADQEQETAEMENDLEKKLSEITDRLQRTMAEFDNFRKRTEKEKAARFEIGARSVIEKILPVLDNFERGLGGVEEEKKEDPFVSGMDKIYKQLTSTLEEIGVKPIEALGQEFNPDFHNAVMHVEDEDAGENTIVEEFQRGYTYKDSVVRYSMVKVAN
ncbi:nucleotide exchange factor GrpE [Cuneatibacter sp. NSJ-177]|uniref:nucleotide exchange factor GrpE n=1 Tax=Cuneatibacter sp. NSJ-177 TaxID=2931401 RepID=UPI001FD076B4|nr:nucleotide exchange factor GrpE [Cuneatibacter sp. NSJ-177]